eukprot:scaffold7514_cov112-Skeletonema_dohrnii-CCMP3373.AAC.3
MPNLPSPKKFDETIKTKPSQRLSPSPSYPLTITLTATMSAEEVANAFVQHFYATFDANADNLGGLFVSNWCSRMTSRYIACSLYFNGHGRIFCRPCQESIAIVSPI